MERLTSQKGVDSRRKAYERRLGQGYSRNIPEERYLRLAAYEDTGMEPEEIGEAQNAMRSALALACWLQAYRAIGPVEELSALVKAQYEGRLVELPCKAGETVYEVALGYLVDTYEYEVQDVSVNGIKYADGWVDISELGKTVFLTRAEAEAAMNGGNDK